MAVSVVIPWRGGCPERERAFDFVRTQFAQKHPDWTLCVGTDASDGGWHKGAAVTDALASASGEIIVQADADVWCDDLAPAVAAVKNGAPWAIPHTLVKRLSSEATTALLTGQPWGHFPLAQQPYQGIPGGGMLIAPREVIRSIPIDPRFTGWG